MDTLTREDFSLWSPAEVRWGDMDSMGHVNNSVYFTYMETARIGFFRSVGVSSGMIENGEGFALVSIKCDFRRQVHYPATLDIGTRITKIGNRSFQLQQGLFQDEQLMAHGESAMCWVDYTQNKAIPLPDKLRAQLYEYLAITENGEA